MKIKVRIPVQRKCNQTFRPKRGKGSYYRPKQKQDWKKQVGF